MHFYLIERNDDWNYDEYNAAVVMAQSPEQALEVLKKEYGQKSYCGWGKYDVKITELSLLDEARVILGSYNAG